MSSCTDSEILRTSAETEIVDYDACTVEKRSRHIETLTAREVGMNIRIAELYTDSGH